MSYYLSRDTSPSHFDCPNCGQTHYVNWTTEYGDPYDGKYDEECLVCGHEFYLTVTSVTRYSVESKEE